MKNDLWKCCPIKSVECRFIDNCTFVANEKKKYIHIAKIAQIVTQVNHFFSRDQNDVIEIVQLISRHTYLKFQRSGRYLVDCV